MRRSIAVVFLALAAWVATAQAEGPEDQYINIYSLIREADGFNDAGELRQAMAKYAEAQAALAKFPSLYPGWNETLIRFRLNYVSTKLAPLTALMSAATNGVTQPLPGGQGATPPASRNLTNILVAQMQAEINRLNSENTSLAAKLKEALSVQPTAVDPREITRAEEKNRNLQKENELLKVTLNQQETKMAKLVSPETLEEANRALFESRGKLETTERTLGALKTENEVLKQQAARTAVKKAEPDPQLNRQLEQTRENLAALQKQYETLASEKKTSESHLKDLETKLAKATESAAKPQPDTRKQKQLEEELNKQVAAAKEAARLQQERVRQLEKDKDKLAGEKTELESRLAKALAKPPARSREDTQQLRQLREEMARQAEASKAALKESQSKADQFERELARLTKEKFDLEDRVAKLAASAADPLPSDSPKLKKLHEEMDRQAKAARQAAQENEARLAQLEKELSQIKKAKAELETGLGSQAIEAGKADAKKRKELEDQIASLRAKLEKAEKQLSQRAIAKGSLNVTQRQLEALQARLTALEAKPEPYTAEELAALRSPVAPMAVILARAGSAPALAATATPTETKATKPKRTATELPPGAGTMDAAAKRDFRAGRFEEAQKKYLEILRQDEKNVYVLGNLASTEMELDKLDEAEKHLAAALQADPQDDYCLYLKGRLYYKRGKLDEALDLLSQAAKNNPESAETQDYLGIVLAEKGLRTQAEAAFRKAIQLQPGYAHAHSNLALVYATQKPPSLALARWHYQKALAAGLPRNAQLEKLLGQ